MVAARAWVQLIAAILSLAQASSDYECGARGQCAGDADDASLLAHRSTGASSRRRRKCSSETGEVTILNPSVGAFSGLLVAGEFDVSLVVGSASSVEVKVDAGLKEYVDVAVVDGELRIRWSDQVPCDDVDDDPDVTVTSPAVLTSISANAGAEVQFPKWPFQLGPGVDGTVGQLALSASSDGEIQMKRVKAESIDVSVSSGGEVDLQWTTADSMTISASSDGEVKGATVQTLVVSASSGAEVTATVIGSATGSVSSGAEFEYSGDGDVSGVTTSSGGTVERD